VSWRTHTQTYDPDRRYVDHSDRKGHSTQFRANLPTPIARQIQELAARNIISEYRTGGDIIADATVHHLHRIGEQIDSGEIRAAVNLAVMLDDAERRRKELEMFEELIRTIDANCAIYYPTSGREARWEGLHEYCMDLLEPSKIAAVPSALRGQYIAVVERHVKAAGVG